MSPSRSIAVVHLLRKANDIVDFQKFLTSYRAFPAGTYHDLVILFKGFSGGDDRQALSCLDGLNFIRIEVADKGYDISVYLDAARRLDYEYFCFFNSFSEILCADWLSYLHSALSSAQVGVVGATGSWESLNDVTVFPNYHIRTTAFMIAGQVMNDLATWTMQEKRDTSLFEAGPLSLTAQLLSRGLEPLVVDSSGRAWSKEDWPFSNTFRIGDQDGLMVADRRTDDYRYGSTDVREYLEKLAWIGGDPGPNPFKKNTLIRRLSRLMRW